MYHVHCRAPSRMTVGLRQVALHNQARAVLHQGKANEGRQRPGARDVL